MSSKKLHKPTKVNKTAAAELARQQAIHADIRERELSFTSQIGLLDHSTPGPLDPEMAHEVIMSREMPSNLFKFENEESVATRALAGSLANNFAPGTSSIAELAAALRNDPQRIYEFVANNIDFIPQYGLMKGAWGCLMDGQGTSFDISALLVELLRAAGITANYLVGQIRLTGAQATNFLGCAINPAASAATVCYAGQIPYSWTQSGTDLATLTISHCWVKWQNPANSLWYVFDPSFKQYTYKTGINLATATGFNQATFIANALSGSTNNLTPNQNNYIQSLNRNNIRSNLATYSTNLINWIKTNNPSACIDDIIGGRTLNPITIPVVQTDLPHKLPGNVPTEYTDIPINYKITCRLMLSCFNPSNVWWFDQTFTSEQLHGRTMTFWTTNGGKNAELRLDGTLIASYSHATYTIANTHQMGNWYTQHNAYVSTFYNGWSEIWSAFDTAPGGTGYMLLGSAFGTMGNGLSQYHADKFRDNTAAGFAADSPEVLGEALAMGYYDNKAYFSRSGDIMGRLGDCRVTNHHTNGWLSYVKGLNDEYSFWVGYAPGGWRFDLTTMSNDNAKRLNVWQAYGAQFVSLEYMGMMNAYDLDGASVNRFADVVASLGGRLDGTLTANSRVLQTVPYLQTYPYKDGVGYSEQTYYDDYGVLNWGGFSKGGIIIEGSPMAPPDCEDCESGGGGAPFWPTNPCARTYDSDDISTGSGEFPYGLTLKRRYCGCDKIKEGVLGLGWSHNFDRGVDEYTSVTRALGSNSPIEAAAAITCAYIVRTLLDSTTQAHLKPFEYMASIASIACWWSDQVYKNAVSVGLLGFKHENFIKLPDGSYNPPLGSAATLTKNGLGIFEYKTPQGVAHTFNAQNRLSTLSYPAGPVVTLAYSGNQLQSVSNGMGRQLNFVYSGNQLSQVNDGAGRSVSYSVNATTKQLDSFTNADGKVSSHTYDQPGRLHQVFWPNSAVNPVLTRTYDSLGRMKSELNSNNQETKYFCAGPTSEEENPAGIRMLQAYDNRGNVRKKTNSLGDSMLYEYDCLRRMTKKLMPEGNSFEYVYDSRNNLISFTAKPKIGSPLSPIVKTFTYDATWNKVKTITDPLLRVTTFNYDPTNGNLLSIIYPLVDGVSPTVSYTYNARGQLSTSTDPTGIVTKWLYDTSTERLLSVIEDFGIGRLNLTTSFGYDAAGNVNSVTDPKGNSSTALFDTMRRLKEITTAAPFSYVSKFTWDSNSNLTKTEHQTGDSLSPWQTTQFAFSPTDKLQNITDPTNNLTAFAYDGLDRLWKVTDAAFQTTEYAYDALNRISTVRNPATNIVETRTYTPNGLLATVKDANNNITTYQYDGFDRLDKVTYPDASYEQNTYDANSNVLIIRTRAGNTVTNTFDTVGRIKTETPQGLATRTYSYDLAGRRTKVNTPLIAGNPTTGDYDYYFDSAGRFFKERNPDGKEVIYQLDANGNITRTTWPDGYFVDCVYDQLNRLTDIKLNGAGTAAAHFDYDPMSRRKKITYQNGCTTDYGYELDDDLSSLVQTFVGSSVSFASISNSVNQITSLSVSDSQFLWGPTIDSVTAAGVNNLNQYQSVSGSSMSYTADGCVAGDGTWTYGYDSLSRLTSAVAGSTSLNFLYDPDDRQTQKQVGATKVRYLYDGMQRIADYDGISGALLTRYVYGTGIDEPLIEVSSAGTTTFFHHDRLGSVIARTNSSGTLLSRYTYGPYGETTSLVGTTFGYTGQRYDTESGLYYYKARYYSPTLGRFLQPDPIGYADGLNLYAYVGSDPLNSTDPLGLMLQGGASIDVGFNPNFVPPPQVRPSTPIDQPGNGNKDPQRDQTKKEEDESSSCGGGGGGGGGFGGPLVAANPDRRIYIKDVSHDPSDGGNYTKVSDGREGQSSNIKRRVTNNHPALGKKDAVIARPDPTLDKFEREVRETRRIGKKGVGPNKPNKRWPVSVKRWIRNKVPGIHPSLLPVFDIMAPSIELQWQKLAPDMYTSDA